MDGYKSHASHRRSGDSVPPDQDELVFIGLDDHGIELWFNTACRMRRDRQRHAGQDDVDITLVVHIYKPYFSAGLEAFAGILKLGMRAIPIALIKIGRHTAVEASGIRSAGCADDKAQPDRLLQYRGPKTRASTGLAPLTCTPTSTCDAGRPVGAYA